MKGKINSTPKGWIVKYFDTTEAHDVMYCGESYPLHPDDVEQIRKDSLIFDNIEARIAAYPDVDFKILQCNGIQYAKLINTVVEDDVEKLAETLNKTRGIDGPRTDTSYYQEFKIGVEMGYNKAKSTLYTEEQVENILIEYVKTNPTKPYSVITWFRKYIQSLKQPKKD